MWNDRYSRPGYLFGTEPNAFLKSCAPLLEPGQSALAIADGEGRNSVWLAGQGLSVTAFDASSVGIEKARRLASQRGVDVDLHLATIEEWDWAPDRYDVVAAIFIQFAAPELRAAIFEGMKRTVKPGGLVLLQGYRPEQIGYGTGGHPVPRISIRVHSSRTPSRTSRCCGSRTMTAWSMKARGTMACRRSSIWSRENLSGSACSQMFLPPSLLHDCDHHTTRPAPFPGLLRIP